MCEFVSFAGGQKNLCMNNWWSMNGVLYNQLASLFRKTKNLEQRFHRYSLNSMVMIPKRESIKNSAENKSKHSTSHLLSYQLITNLDFLPPFGSQKHNQLTRMNGDVSPKRPFWKKSPEIGIMIWHQPNERNIFKGNPSKLPYICNNFESPKFHGSSPGMSLTYAPR